MNTRFHLHDLYAVAPWGALLCGALLLLLLAHPSSRSKHALWIAGFAIACTLGFTIARPPQSMLHSLVTEWLDFSPGTTEWQFLFLTIGLLLLPVSYRFLENSQERHEEYAALWLVSLSGLILIPASRDLLSLFLGIETFSIPLYILCGYARRSQRGHEASLKYFIFNSIGTALLLYGAALAYGAQGNTHLPLKIIFENREQTLLMRGALALMLSALAFKGSIFPLHAWVNDVYRGTPSPVAALLATAGKGAALVALTLVFSPFFSDLTATPPFSLLRILAIITLAYGSLMALRQSDWRSLMAYSGIAQSALLLLPVMTPSPNSSLLPYFTVYSLATILLFSLFSTQQHCQKPEEIDALEGIGHSHPLQGGAATLACLSLAGLPPTIGFITKFSLFSSSAHPPAFLVSVTLASLLSISVYLKLLAKVWKPHVHIARSASNPTVWISASLLAALSLFPFLLFG